MQIINECESQINGSIGVTTEDTLSAAHKYLDIGWRVIPVPPGTKAPVIKDWTNFQCKKENLEFYFNPTDNIAVITGTPSGKLVDIDLDCEEAIRLAPYFLPPTERISGHAKSPSSHWFYRVD